MSEYPEYIERKAVMKIIDDRSLDTNNNAIDIIRSAVRKLPDADAVPVSHGHWAHLGGDEWCCSNCGFIIATEGSWEHPERKFCENCGAKIDEG